VAPTYCFVVESAISVHEHHKPFGVARGDNKLLTGPSHAVRQATRRHRFAGSSRAMLVTRRLPVAAGARPRNHRAHKELERVIDHHGPTSIEPIPIAKRARYNDPTDGTKQNTIATPAGCLAAAVDRELT